MPTATIARRLRIVLAAASCMGYGALQAQEQLVFTSWGGTTQQAQKQFWTLPFNKASGISVALEGPTDYARLKAMVDSGNVTWDVVDVEADFAYKAAKDGLLEPLDFSVINKDQLDPRFATPHAVGSFYYSFVLGYNKKALGSEKPENWSDLFDLKRFPGKRTFYKWSAPGALEIALLADGVAPDKLYPLDLDRAFKKLDTIKSQIAWWSGGAESQQLLSSGQAPIGMFWNGRVHFLVKTGQEVGISWNQNLVASDMLVIPKGARKKELAMKLIALATSAEAQAGFASATGFAPINTKSRTLMPAAVAGELPDQHTQGQITLNMKYWAENRDAIGKRWSAWQAK